MLLIIAKQAAERRAKRDQLTAEHQIACRQKLRQVRNTAEATADAAATDDDDNDDDDWYKKKAASTGWNPLSPVQPDHQTKRVFEQNPARKQQDVRTAEDKTMLG